MPQEQCGSCWGLTRAAVSASSVAPFPPLQSSEKVIVCWKLEVGGRRSKVVSCGLMFREKQCFAGYPEGLSRLEKWAHGNLLMRFSKAKCKVLQVQRRWRRFSCPIWNPKKVEKGSLWPNVYERTTRDKLFHVLKSNKPATVSFI